MSTQGFIAKDDFRFPNLDEMFLGDGEHIYLIEDVETCKWLTERHGWTLKISEALQFTSNIKAKTYAVENNLSGWIITKQNIKL